MQFISTFFARGSGRMTVGQLAAIALLLLSATSAHAGSVAGRENLTGTALESCLGRVNGIQGKGRVVYPPSSAGTAIDPVTGRPPVRHQAGSTRRQPRTAQVSQLAIELQCRYMALYQGFPYGLCLEKWNNANK